MAIIPFSQLRAVNGIFDPELHDIKVFMRGAVYCWMKNHPTDWFAVHDLVGGLINDWEGTPLRKLRDMHDATHPGNERAAHDQAGRDLGWIVKSMLHAEERSFRTRRVADQPREYLWIQDPAGVAATEADDQAEDAPDDDRP
jgi:hypothetical protein